MARAKQLLRPVGGARGQRASQQGGPHLARAPPHLSPHTPGKGREGGGPWGVTRLGSGNPTHNVHGTSAAPGRRACFSGTGGRNQRLELHFLAGGCPTLRSEGSVFWTSLRSQIVVHVTPQRPVSIGEISRLEAMGRQGLLLSRGQMRTHCEPVLRGVWACSGHTDPGPGCRRFAGRSQKRSRQIRARGRTPPGPPLPSAFLGRLSEVAFTLTHGKGRGTRAGGTACPMANPRTEGPRAPERGRDLPRRSPHPPVSTCRRRVTQGDD